MTAVDAGTNSLWFQDVGCLRDLPFLYEVTTADDVYNAYNYLSLCDNSLFTCMGVAGSEVGKGVAITEEIITGMQWGSRILQFIVIWRFIVLVPMYVVLLLILELMNGFAEDESPEVGGMPSIHGRGMSTMTRPTTWVQLPNLLGLIIIGTFFLMDMQSFLWPSISLTLCSEQFKHSPFVLKLIVRATVCYI